MNKTVEILGLEIYCSTSQGTLSLVAIDDNADYKLGEDARLEGNKNDYILAPFDVSVTLLVCVFGQNPFTQAFFFSFLHAYLTGILLQNYKGLSKPSVLADAFNL